MDCFCAEELNSYQLRRVASVGTSVRNGELQINNYDEPCKKDFI